jgi:predicted glutamine amidotransferase
MCRMFGIASKNNISQELFVKFAELASTGRVKPSMTEQHQDGWGVSGYLGKWGVHFGRSKNALAESKPEFDTALKKSLISGSKILIAHIRKASIGDLRLENTHPFVRGNWIFCHNGTIENPERLLVPGIEYEGSTDSEKLFVFIKTRLFLKGPKDFNNSIIKAVKDVKALCDTTSLTFIMSNGDKLIGYRDFSEEEEYYTLYYSASPGAFMFCSEPLEGFDWNSMKNGELLILEKTGEFLSETNENKLGQCCPGNSPTLIQPA